MSDEPVYSFTLTHDKHWGKSLLKADRDAREASFVLPGRYNFVGATWPPVAAGSQHVATVHRERRVFKKVVPDGPHETWLVLDGTNGQNAIQQAREFMTAVEVTGLIIAKLDGTARGGAIFGIKQALGLPVRFIGTGEEMDLLEPFEPEAFVDAILGKALSGKTAG